MKGFIELTTGTLKSPKSILINISSIILAEPISLEYEPWKCRVHLKDITTYGYERQNVREDYVTVKNLIEEASL